MFSGVMFPNGVSQSRGTNCSVYIRWSFCNKDIALWAVYYSPFIAVLPGLITVFARGGKAIRPNLLQ